MKEIAKWIHLEPHGIDPLTREACALGYRMLCDVTAEGRKIVLRALGIPDIALHPAWNSGTKDAPHVGSLMLASCTLEYLAVFALLEDGAREVWTLKSGTVIGVYPDDTIDDIESMRCMTQRMISRRVVPSPFGDRNVHQVSQRLE